METDEEDEIQSPPIHPNSHEDEVKKLKKRLRDLGKQHDTLLDNAKNNAKIAQKLYKEHIEHTAALTATGKDPGEILRPLRHGMGFLKDKALRMMEPIICDYVNNPPHERKQMTKYVYEKYEHFESELRNAFGIMDEKRMAEMKIR
ncbi:Ankyrin-1 [Fusarium oxysporum f. sp. albedinis]|nr:Ankyrin-1 [Fusarium oxysporum f. sp. albedinis]